MLETIREFGQERLQESGDEISIRRAHAQCFLALVEAAWPGEGEGGGLWGSDAPWWFDRLDREHDNIRAALAWSHAEPGESETELRLLVSIWGFWLFRGFWAEGHGWMERALARDEPLGPRAAWARVGVLRGASHLAGALGDGATVRTRVEESLALARALDHKEGIAWALSDLDWRDGDASAMRRRLEEALAMMRQLGHKAGIAECVQGLACLYREQGDHEAARTLEDEALSLRLATGRLDTRAWALNVLANRALDSGDVATARSHLLECLECVRSLGFKAATAAFLSRLAECSRIQGDFPEARALYEESLARFRALGVMEHVADLSRELEELALLEAGSQ
jgi:non-specific serine/threonine protein kinase